MYNSGSSQKNGPHHRTLVPAILVIVITLCSSAGCMDKGILEDIIEKVEGDEGPDYVWTVLLTDQGNFELNVEANTNPNYYRIAVKIIENLTNNDPTQTPNNLKQILNEENISMKKKVYTFVVLEGTHKLNIELECIFKTGIETGPTGGYMELTLINPDNKRITEEIVQFEEQDKYTLPQTPVPGKWTVELQGIGLQDVGAFFYSGKYVITVRAEEPKES